MQRRLKQAPLSKDELFVLLQQAVSESERRDPEERERRIRMEANLYETPVGNLVDKSRFCFALWFIAKSTRELDRRLMQERLDDIMDQQELIRVDSPLEQLNELLYTQSRFIIDCRSVIPRDAAKLYKHVRKFHPLIFFIC
jgi:hypothetical protein